MKKVSSHEVGRLESRVDAALLAIDEVRQEVEDALLKYSEEVEFILFDGLDAVDPDKGGVRVKGKEIPGY